jgi:NADH-quinone oxidoreductase subunit M
MAVISILYGAVLALRQENFKKLVAYSSLSHMGYIVLGIFSFQEAAVHGALFQILSHGVAAAGLFLLLGLLEERLGDSYRQLTALSTYAPRLAVLLMLLILTSVGLPLTSGFTGEFMILFGGFQQGFSTLMANAGSLTLVSVLLACTGMVIGAAYMLRFGRVILYGHTRDGVSVSDLSIREGLAFIPILIMIVWVGICPSSIMGKVQGSVTQMTNHAAAPATPAAAPITTPAIGGANGH